MILDHTLTSQLASPPQSMQAKANEVAYSASMTQPQGTMVAIRGDVIASYIASNGWEYASSSEGFTFFRKHSNAACVAAFPNTSDSIADIMTFCIMVASVDGIDATMLMKELTGQ